MRTSTTILEKIVHVLTLPGWQYVPWTFTPYYRPYPEHRRASMPEDPR